MDAVDTATIEQIIAENKERLVKMIGLFSEAPKEKLDPSLSKLCADFNSGGDPVLFLRNLGEKVAMTKTEDIFVAKAIEASLMYFQEKTEEEALRRANLSDEVKKEELPE